MSSTLAGLSTFNQVKHGGQTTDNERIARLAAVLGGLGFSVASWAAIVIGVEAIFRLV